MKISYISMKVLSPKQFDRYTHLSDLYLENKAIIFKGLPIVTFFPSYIVLCNWGNFLPGVKSRMNQFLPVGVSLYQKDYVWMLKGIGWETPFQEGIRLTYCGKSFTYFKET